MSLVDLPPVFPSPRHWRAGWLFCMLGAILATHVQAQEPLPAGVVIDLQDQLERGLKARLPEEFAYIRRVADLVRMDQLPLDLVRSTFHYARHKRPFPIQYFHRALRIRAAQIGISVESLELGPPVSG